MKPSHTVPPPPHPPPTPPERSGEEEGVGADGGTFQLFYINIKKESWLPQSGGWGDGGDRGTLIIKIDEQFNLCIEYKSKPRLFSKYSWIFSRRASCFSVDLIEKTGSTFASAPPRRGRRRFPLSFLYFPRSSPKRAGKGSI